MLLVAPDPRLGIAPERIARVRVLLDSAPRAAGIAVALPGGADGVLDALVVRPDAVLGLVPGAPGARGAGDGSAAGVVELERLLALADPVPAAPRRVVPVPRGDGTPDGARRALGAPVATPVLAAEEIRSLFRALRLAEHTPGSDALSAAGFPGHAARPASVTAPAPAPTPASAASGPAIAPAPAAVSAPETAPAAASAPATAPAAVAAGGAAVVVEAVPTTPVPTRRTDDPAEGPAAGGGDEGTRDETDGDRDHGALPGAGGLAVLGLADAPAPRRADGGPAAGNRVAAVPADRPGARPSTGRPAAGPGAGWHSRVPGWAWSWRGLAVAAAVAFLVASGLALLVGRSAVPAATTVAATDPTATVVVGGVAYTRRAAAADTSCAGHAYGLAARFLAERPCRRLDRTLWSGDSPTGPTVLAVSVVRMDDAASAAALKSLVDSSGTGNLADLPREGRSYPGGPTGLTDAGYGSAIVGDTVVVAESDFLDPARRDEPSLDGYARQAVDAGVGRP